MSITPKPPVTSILEQNLIMELAAKNRRIDGRTVTDYREIKVETGIIEKANGSAQVSLGKTKVMAGVKLELGEPFLDTPDEGVLTVNAEFTPIASPTFELGPPGENSIELARIVDRNLRESKAIDLKRLCIIPGKKVFIVFVDINILNHDGNLIDASTYAALAALLNTKMNDFEVKGDSEVVIREGLQPLPMNNYPVPVTFAKIGGTLIIDPQLQEEDVMSMRLTIGVEKNGCICAIQKGGMGELEPEDIRKAVGLAVEKSKELRALIVGGS
ncbi:MAG: exosome complex protein Rrp42 [Candidatus Bathyarchaeia archaeon]